MRREATYLTLALLLMPLSSIVLHSVNGGETSTTSNIIIDGDMALASSPFVSSGDGSASNPYMISNIAMDSGSIKITNTTKHCVLENITFSSGDAYAISLDYTSNIRLSWITIDGRRNALEAIDSSDLSISHMRIVNITQRGRSVTLSNVDTLTIAHSRFSVNNPGSPAYIMMDQLCSGRLVRNNTFIGYFLNIEKLSSGEKVFENRFQNSTLELFNSTEGAQITDNEFVSPLYFGIFYQTSIGALFENNYFECTEGIRLETPVYNYQVKTIARNNTFESCGKGISVDTLNVMSRLIGWIMYDNYFSNCSGLAIEIGYGFYNIAYNNIFYHNAGTDDRTPGAQVSQLYGGTGYYVNSWTHDGKGNFWANHRTPDVDGNGIVDVPYTFSVGGEDKRPYSNIKMDTVRPAVGIVAPSPGRITGSYQRVQWDASDENGIGVQRLIVDGVEYNVTGKNLKSLNLQKGDHDIEINVTDSYGLTNMTYVNVTLEKSTDIVNILEPADKEHISSIKTFFNWTVIPAFPVVQQTLVVNGKEIALSPEARSHEVEMTEGINTLVLRVRDDGDLELSFTRTVTVDLRPPVIDVICPAPGSYLTNELVKFRWSVQDENTVAMVETKLDGEDWVKRDVTEMNVMTSKGPHTFSIRARDIAGNTLLKDIPFTIGDDPSLTIITPENGMVTRMSTIEFTWDYTGAFNYTRVFVRVGNASQYIDVGGSRSFDVMLERSTRHEDEGIYFITLKLEDEYGNYLEASTSVIRDNTAPRVVFDLPEEFPNTNRESVVLKWRGIDDWGVSSYSIRVNDDDWLDLGTATEYDMDLDEGHYLIEVRAEDRGGNIGRKETTFVVDRTAPSLQITGPEANSILKTPEVVFSWKVSDQIGLDNVTFTMDGSVTIDVTGMSMLARTVLDEGEHTAEITAIDTCGNLRTRQVLFTVDLTPPMIEWSDLIPLLVNASSIRLDWEVADLVGLVEQRLLVDGEERSLGLEERNLTIELEDGVHSIELIAVDLADRESSSILDITVDTTPPTIAFDPERCTVEDNIARVYWEASDDTSGVQEGSIMISVDGGEFKTIPLDDRYFTDVLPPGLHDVRVKARDKAGNEASVKWEFTIEEPEKASSGKGGIGGAIIVIGIVVVLLASASVVIYVFLRKGDKQKGGPAINKPQRLTLAIPAARDRPAMGPSSAPALPSKKVEESSTGTGYIRPEKNGNGRPSTLKNGNGSSDLTKDESAEQKAPEGNGAPRT
ncbi:MAG: hypothetical protein ACMUHM_05425 [Thermoplasmatota archaeon]